MRRNICDLAVQEAYRSGQNFKHGAVIVRSGKVLSSGHNKVTTRCPSHMYSIHAEMAAIKQSNVKNNLDMSHLYVVRVNKCGLAESKPCAKCQQYMRIHGIKRVFYSTGNGDEFDSMYLN